MSNKAIRTLSHREQCREKLPVYFGSNDNYYHSVREVVINARDILQHLDNGLIEIILHDDCKTITIKDNGSGLPFEGETGGVPNYELLFLTLFSGTKMDDGGTDGGTNGCGNTVICYTSDYFKAITNRKGKKYSIAFKDGGEIYESFKCLGDTEDTGTEITFRLSDEVYTETKFSIEEINSIAEKVCATSHNIRSICYFKDMCKEYHYNGLYDYADTYFKNKALEDNIYLQSKQFKNELENTDVEIVINTTEDTIQHSFLNGIYLPEQGTIHDGVLSGMKTVLNKFAKVNNLYNKGEKQLGIKDIENTISYVASVSSTKVSYANQTKFSTKKELYKDVVQKYIEEFFEAFCIECKEDMINLTNKVLISKRADEKADNIRSAVKKKLSEKVDGMTNRVEKLTDCKFHDERSEIFIAEGESAKGSIVLARNPHIQAVYPLRGKILSCLKASYEEIFSNEVILELIKVLGCGVEVKSKHNKELNSFDISKLRYGKVVIATDEDFDGYNIRVLILTMIYRLMPELIYQGKIYIAQTPLFVIKNKDKVHYAFNEKDKEKLLKELTGKIEIGRAKGLGELDADDMYHTAINPQTRSMIKVTVGEVEKMIEKFELWMGEEVEPRRNYIEEHLHEYFSYEE